MPEVTKAIITPLQALEKAKSYCAYQERCQQEVRDKLYEWGQYPDKVESIIAELITENFLNEERFATAYAGGKFRIKQWGRIKIKLALKQKKISDYCIKKALAAIDEADYLRTCQHLAEKKAKSVEEKNPLVKKYKVIQYLLGKGYENDTIQNVLKHL